MPVSKYVGRDVQKYIDVTVTSNDRDRITENNQNSQLALLLFYSRTQDTILKFDQKNILKNSYMPNIVAGCGKFSSIVKQ